MKNNYLNQCVEKLSKKNVANLLLVLAVAVDKVQPEVSKESLADAVTLVEKLLDDQHEILKRLKRAIEELREVAPSLADELESMPESEKAEETEHEWTTTRRNEDGAEYYSGREKKKNEN